MHPGVQPEEIVEEVEVRAIRGRDDLGASADRPTMKPEDFERNVRHDSILHPLVAVPPPLLGLIGASLHDLYLACWECVGASWEGIENSLEGLKISREGFRAICEGVRNG